ncbi:MAG: DUF4239 domain-containing protein [Verrucomicrobiota bacterium]
MNSVYLFVVVFTIVVGAGTLVFLELGRHFGLQRLARDTEGARAGMGAVEGAVFGLLGLIIAFTFSGASTRFDQRRQMIVQEANAAGTAYLRLDLLPASDQPKLRELMRQYVDSRIRTYQLLPDYEAVGKELGHSAQLQGELWKGAVAASTSDGGQRTALLVLTPLNELFDLRSSRIASTRIHAPRIIFILLGLLVMVSSLLAGIGMASSRRRSWIHMIGFSLIMCLAVYVILDLEYPRFGLINMEASDHFLIEARQGMN